MDPLAERATCALKITVAGGVTEVGFAVSVVAVAAGPSVTEYEGDVDGAYVESPVYFAVTPYVPGGRVLVDAVKVALPDFSDLAPSRNEP